MDEIPTMLAETFRNSGQAHVLRHWPQLTPDERRELVQELQSVDPQQVASLIALATRASDGPSSQQIEPIEPDRLDRADHETIAVGEEALRSGQVAALIVAGGQGTRLGFDKPKGMFPIGPDGDRCLFQIHCEKVLDLRRRYDCPLPLLVMTSAATDAPTRQFFAEHDNFRLPARDVMFFCQGGMPSIDMRSGKLLMSEKNRLCISPNGHGGVLPALRDEHLLQRLIDQGVRHLFYFQVDNPLVRIADPLFLGHHIRRGADVSTKSVAKTSPSEKVGNLVLIDGKCSMIEYSDLSDDLATKRDDAGRLLIRCGNIAVHIFDMAFLQRVGATKDALPFHVARKIVPYYDGERTIEPQEENAFKFEKFIFDVLPHARAWTVVEIDADDEYAPLKNKEGTYSPDWVRDAMRRRDAKGFAAANS